MIDDREFARRLVLAMVAHALVDGREVVEHFVGTVDACLKMTQNIVDLVASHPECGDLIARGLFGENGVAEGCFEVSDDGVG